MAESLHCSPKTITTFLIGYTPKQNVFGVKKNNKKKKKCTDDLNRHVSKERHTDVQEVWEKVCWMSPIRKCKSKTQWYIISHLLGRLLLKRQEITELEIM